MWPEKCDTAERCAAKFLKLMKDRPQNWGDNVNDAVADLEDGDEQVKFLAWMADPRGTTNNRHGNIPTRTDFPNVSFETHPNYEVTRTIPGKLPKVFVNYTPQTEEDDEKILTIEN